MTMNAYKEKWLKKQLGIWDSLEGLELKKVFAIPEPLDWKDEDETIPIHSHPSIRFQHLAKVWMVLSDNRVLKVTTSEDEDVFGVFVSEDGSIDLSDERIIEVSWSGEIKNPIVKIERDNIAEVRLKISDKTKIIVSGEVEPQWDGYIIRKLDESIMLFENEDDSDNTVFGKSHRINLKEN